MLRNKLIKRFFVSSRGANLIEFAFVAPIFLLILIGLFDVGGMLVIQNALDAGAREAARFGLTGGTSDGLAREDAIRERVLRAIKTHSGGIIPIDKVLINVSSYDSIENVDSPEPYEDINKNGAYDVGEVYEDTNGNNQWDPDRGASGSFGAGGEAVKYEVSYDWKPFLSLFGFKDNMRLVGQATVRNEDFNYG